MPRLLRQQRHRLLRLPPQKHRRRNQIPDILRNHISRKKVDLLQRVRFAVRVRLELAQISILRPAIRRFHLHPQNPVPRFNPHILSRRISPGLRHLEPIPHRPRHKLQLHPLPAFLESPEPLALSHPHSHLPKFAHSGSQRHNGSLVIPTGAGAAGTAERRNLPSPTAEPTSGIENPAPKEKARPIGRASIS